MEVLIYIFSVLYGFMYYKDFIYIINIDLRTYVFLCINSMII